MYVERIKVYISGLRDSTPPFLERDSLCQLCMLGLDFADFVDLWMSFWKISMRFCDE